MMPARKSNWLPGIFNDFFGNEWLQRQNSSAPAVNIIENEKQYLIEIATPGMSKEDFRIELHEDNQLVVTMEKKSEKTEGNFPGNRIESQGQNPDNQDAPSESEHPSTRPSEDKARNRYLRREFSYTSFRQSLILPDNVDKQNIKAKVEDGVLNIEIPKVTEEEKAKAAKQITVE